MSMIENKHKTFIDLYMNPHPVIMFRVGTIGSVCVQVSGPFQILFPAQAHWEAAGGSSSAWSLYPPGRPSLTSGLLVFAWPSFSCCGNTESEPIDEKFPPPSASQNKYILISFHFLCLI